MTEILLTRFLIWIWAGQLILALGGLLFPRFRRILAPVIVVAHVVTIVILSRPQDLDLGPLHWVVDSALKLQFELRFHWPAWVRALSVASSTFIIFQWLRGLITKSGHGHLLWCQLLGISGLHWVLWSEPNWQGVIGVGFLILAEHALEFRPSRAIETWAGWWLVMSSLSLSRPNSVASACLFALGLLNLLSVGFWWTLRSTDERLRSLQWQWLVLIAGLNLNLDANPALGWVFGIAAALVVLSALLFTERKSAINQFAIVMMLMISGGFHLGVSITHLLPMLLSGVVSVVILNELFELNASQHWVLRLGIMLVVGFSPGSPWLLGVTQGLTGLESHVERQALWMALHFLQVGLLVRLVFRARGEFFDMHRVVWLTAILVIPFFFTGIWIYKGVFARIFEPDLLIYSGALIAVELVWIAVEWVRREKGLSAVPHVSLEFGLLLGRSVRMIAIPVGEQYSQLAGRWGDYLNSGTMSQAVLRLVYGVAHWTGSATSLATRGIESLLLAVVKMIRKSSKVLQPQDLLGLLAVFLVVWTLILFG